MSEPTAERRRFLCDRISDVLDSYESGNTNLADLVREVETAVNALFEVADAAWANHLRTAWSGLEIVHAGLLDEGRRSLDDEEFGEIEEAIRELRTLLLSRGGCENR